MNGALFARLELRDGDTVKSRKAVARRFCLPCAMTSCRRTAYAYLRDIRRPLDSALCLAQLKSSA